MVFPLRKPAFSIRIVVIFWDWFRFSRGGELRAVMGGWFDSSVPPGSPGTFPHSDIFPRLPPVPRQLLYRRRHVDPHRIESRRIPLRYRPNPHYAVDGG